MSQLEVNIYKQGNTSPDKQITMPLSVLRINPKLLPEKIAKVLESQGIAIAEIASLEGVEGTILDITGASSRIVVSINKATADEPRDEPKPELTVEIPIVPSNTEPVPPPAPPPPREEPAKKQLTPFQQRLTTEFIAREIGWRTGHDLIYAACAHMHIVQGNTAWTADDIDSEIKLASNYYKPFYSTNLNEYLQYLIKNNKLALDNNNLYVLSADTLDYLSDRLSEDKLKKRV